VNGKPSTEGLQGAVMKKPIKILHIDPDYQVSYFIIRDGSFIHSSVPRKAAIALLKNENFDLVISEPHHRAVLSPQEESKNEKLRIKPVCLSGSKEPGWRINMLEKGSGC
jgi:hypothetical protein